MLGKLIHDYKLEAMLGEGGMATVYSARNIHTDHEIAIKVMDHKLARSESAMIRFQNEATLGMGLKHPNIAKVYKSGELEGHPCILMEKIDGVMLSQFLEQNGNLSISLKLQLFQQMLSAIGYAHSMKVVHRDLKPSNIMVDTKSTTIYILDFGVARLDVAEGAGLTKTGMQIGSIPYMSPEQIAGIKNIDYRTDIYSLGLLLYEVLTGQPVYDSRTENSLLFPGKIINDPVPTIELPNAARMGLNEVIAQATAKKPEERYASCSEFQEAIRSEGSDTILLEKEKVIPSATSKTEFEVPWPESSIKDQRKDKYISTSSTSANSENQNKKALQNLCWVSWILIPSQLYLSAFTINDIPRHPFNDGTSIGFTLFFTLSYLVEFIALFGVIRLQKKGFRVFTLCAGSNGVMWIIAGIVFDEMYRSKFKDDHILTVILLTVASLVALLTYLSAKSQLKLKFDS